ncbi:molecular chaperone [Micractinium conductrix]|uniref:Molecular chaperone n=1 Tax=Micractinium conductrix TaxID=554055 RepID=A0A2P6V9B4_9CHLO|nr:molecular chaperone [Micractinium conductrix]|eukprot:PSC70671.1 molecular chaperone [Micractinium conductrix]
MVVCSHAFAGAALAQPRAYRPSARGRRLGLQVSSLRASDSNRDPYELLGVARGATEDDIKKAHRKLVKQHHPDVRSGDPMAHARFLSIQEAYELLVGKRQGKDVDEMRGAGGRGGWSFHDWYWSFSMRRRSKAASGGAFTGAAGGAEVPPVSAEHWRLQMEGLRSKAAAKRSQRPRRQAPTADADTSGAGASAASPPAGSSAAREQVWRSMTKNAKNADKAAAAQALGSKSREAAQAAVGAGPPPAAPSPASPLPAADAASQHAGQPTAGRAAQQEHQQHSAAAASEPSAEPAPQHDSPASPASPGGHHLRLRQLADAAAAAVRGLQSGRHLRGHLSLQQLAAMLGGRSAGQEGAAGNAVPADQQLHHKFEATRLRRQQQQQQHDAAPHAEHAAAQHAEHAPGAEHAAEGDAAAAAPAGAQHAFRNADHTRKFADRDEVEGRLSTQLSGLKRRAALKQEVRTYGLACIPTVCCDVT